MGTKVRWGDTLDDEDALPPTTVKGPDANGVKVVTEYYKGEKGEAFKKTTKTKIVKVEKKVYKVRGADQVFFLVAAHRFLVLCARAPLLGREPPAFGRIA